MSGWKGGGLLLILAIPLAFYAAWQIKSVVRADMVVSDPPPDRGGTKEQLAQVKDRATKGAADARKASTVALQYQREPNEVPGEAITKEVAHTAKTRATNLNDLDLFLAGVDLAKINGTLKAQYGKWAEEVKDVQKAAKNVEDWLNDPAVLPNLGTDATVAVSDFERRIKSYEDFPHFPSKKDAAMWRVRGRLKIIKELGTRAEKQYPAARDVPLPLKPGHDAMKAALITFAAVKAQDNVLQTYLKEAEKRGVDLNPYGEDMKARDKIVTLCRSRQKLLELFARDDLFTNPNGAAPWLREIESLYRDSNDEGDRAAMRKKVQQFCGTFIPPAVRLDDDVVFQGNTVRRADVTVEYEPQAGARLVTAALAESTKGLNEFTLKERFPGKTTEVRHKSEPGKPDELKPTPVSRAALKYNEARESLGTGTSGPQWSVKTVEDLKKKCEEQKDLVEKVKLPGARGSGSDPELRIWTRLNGLIEGLQACPDDLLNG